MIYPREALAFHRLISEEQLRAAAAFHSAILSRRSVRSFSPEPVAIEVLENAIRSAALAPNGANQQPWRFVVVRDPEIKRQISESVGIAVGFLLAALHFSGLATLVHTPSPMGFLSKILERPSNERPFVLIPVGYPTPDATVPVLPKKTLSELMIVK